MNSEEFQHSWAPGQYAHFGDMFVRLLYVSGSRWRVQLVRTGQKLWAYEEALKRDEDGEPVP